MLFIAVGLLLPEQGRPGLRHDVHLGTRAIGPKTGWMAAGGSSSPTSSSCRASPRSPASTPSCCSAPMASPTDRFWVGFVGVIWIVVMTCDLRHRDRALRPHPGRPARRRDRHPRDLRRRSPWPGSTARASRAALHPTLGWLNPFAHLVDRRLGRRHPHRRLHLLGLGHGGHGQRGGQGHQDARPASRPCISTLVLVGIYVIVVDRRAGVPRRRASSTNNATTCSTRSAGDVFGIALGQVPRSSPCSPRRRRRRRRRSCRPHARRCRWRSTRRSPGDSARSIRAT